jgi:hypothetical protein
LFQHLLSISIFNEQMCGKICEQVIVKSLLATSSYNACLLQAKNRPLPESGSNGLNSSLTEFNFAKFIDQTYYVYNTNPFNETFD